MERKKVIHPFLPFFMIMVLILAGCTKNNNPLSSGAGSPGQPSTARTLHLHVTYTGAYQVSESHPIKVVLFNNDALQGDPYAFMEITAPDATLHFSGILFSPVYILTFLDVNKNGEQIGGTPYLIYDARTNTPATPFSMDPATSADLNIAFADTFLYQGTSDVIVWDSTNGQNDFSAFTTAYYGGQNTYIYTSDQAGQGVPYLTIGFPGNTTGTYNESTGLQLEYYDGTDYYDASSDGGTGSLKVIQYEAIGGHIAGFFSGVLTNFGNGTSYKIENGLFYITRGFPPPS